MPADCTFVYANLAVGGGILIEENYKELAKHYGITHIINGQAEYDDTPLARMYGMETAWCPLWDDFSVPQVDSLRKAVKFVEKSILVDKKAKLLCHCAGGVHRGPMLALLAALRCNVPLKDAIEKIESRRMIASFPDTYRSAVVKFWNNYNK